MNISIDTIENTANLSKAIYNSLKKQILNLELLPGEKMSEAKISKMMGCSRTPVRDAFYQLRVEGFLESRPQIGTFVPKIDMRRVEEVRFIRESVEIAVIKYGMKHNLFAPHIKTLRALVDEQERVYANGEYDAFNDLDMEFHEMFRKITGKECAKLYCGDEDINYARLRFMSVRYEKNWHIAIEHHQAILNAIERGNIEAMENAVAIHLNNLYFVLETTELNNPQIISNYPNVTPEV